MLQKNILKALTAGPLTPSELVNAVYPDTRPDYAIDSVRVSIGVLRKKGHAIVSENTGNRREVRYRYEPKPTVASIGLKYAREALRIANFGLFIQRDTNPDLYAECERSVQRIEADIAFLEGVA